MNLLAEILSVDTVRPNSYGSLSRLERTLIRIASLSARLRAQDVRITNRESQGLNLAAGEVCVTQR